MSSSTNGDVCISPSTHPPPDPGPSCLCHLGSGRKAGCREGLALCGRVSSWCCRARFPDPLLGLHPPEEDKG